MILRRKYAASYPLNARTSDGQRLETDTIVAATFTMDQGGGDLLVKTLTDGLEIRHSDDAGDGFLYVIINNLDLMWSGKTRQRLLVECCDGSIYPVNLRPEFVYIED